MNEHELDILDDDIDDLPVLSRWDLDAPVDLLREDLEDDVEDDLGIRSLYENPEGAFPDGWPYAA